VTRNARSVVGCLVVGVLVLILFANVSIIWWPILIVLLVIVFVVAAAMGLLRGILDALFGRRRG
jgi:hypothetical protein